MENYNEYGNFELLSKEELNMELTRIQGGDKEARERLIMNNMGLVVHRVVSKYGYLYEEIEEMISYGMIGLVYAVDSFGFWRKKDFYLYLYECIDYEVNRYIEFIYRENVLEREMYQDDLVIDRNIDIESDYIEKDRLDFVNKYIYGFDDCDRNIMMKKYSNGDVVNNSKVARELGVSQLRVYWTDRYIKNKLAKSLCNYGYCDKKDIVKKKRKKI